MKLSRFGIVYAQVLALEVLALGAAWSLSQRTHASAAGMAARSFGRKVVVHGIRFDADRTSLGADAAPLLREALDSVSGGGPATLVIASEDREATDPDATNRLADAVRGFLVEHGVRPGRVHVSGEGETCRLVAQPGHGCVTVNLG